MTDWDERIGKLLETHAAVLEKRDEQRSSSRILVPPGLLLVFAVRPNFRCHYAYGHDLSARGLSFLSDHPLEPGSVLALQFRPPDEGQELTKTRMATVRHTNESGGGWLVGCELRVSMTGDELGDLVS